MRAPCVKECQKVISPSSGASDSAVEEASVEAAVLVSAVLAAVAGQQGRCHTGGQQRCKCFFHVFDLL